MLALARTEAPLECCGLLAGISGKIAGIFRANNALASKSAYEIAPAELFELFRTLRERRLDLMGIYHSHPHSQNVPSPTDIQNAFYPETPYFIISPEVCADRPIRAFQIREGSVTELEIVLE